MDSDTQPNEPPKSDDQMQAVACTVSPVGETRSSLLFGHTPKEAIELATKLAIALSALAYVAGLLIVNVYLSRVGMSYIGLPHVHYMMVGIVYIILLMFGCTPWIVVRRMYIISRAKSFRRRDKAGLMAVTFIIIIAFLYLFALALVAVSDREIDYQHPRTLGPMGVVLLIGLASIGGILAYYRKNALALPEQVAPTQHLNVVLSILANLTMHLLYIVVYVSTIYPAISPTFSGGKCQNVIMVSKADQLETFRSFGYKIDTNTRRIGPVRMILEFDKFILLLPPDKKHPSPEEPKAIRIREDMVESILFFKGSEEKK